MLAVNARLMAAWLRLRSRVRFNRVRFNLVRFNRAWCSFSKRWRRLDGNTGGHVTAGVEE